MSTNGLLYNVFVIMFLWTNVLDTLYRFWACYFWLNQNFNITSKGKKPNLLQLKLQKDLQLKKNMYGKLINVLCEQSFISGISKPNVTVGNSNPLLILFLSLPIYFKNII